MVRTIDRSLQATPAGMRILGRCLLLGSIMAAFPWSARAQVVMLPTWRSFSVNTSVMVPDGGSVVLGGVTHGWQSCVTRGWGPWRYPLCQQGWGYTTSSVHATIIDHAAWDAAVMAERPDARGRLSWAGAQVRRVPAGAFVDVPRSVPLQPDLAADESEPETPVDDFAARAERMSLAEIRAELQQREVAARKQSHAEVLALLREGDASRAAGRLPAARVSYRAALRQADGELKTLLVARVAEVTEQMASAKQTTARSDDRLILGPPSANERTPAYPSPR